MFDEVGILKIIKNMILKGEKIYIKEGLKEEDYSLILKGCIDLEVVGFIYFAKKVSSFRTIEEAKKFVNGVEGETVFGIYTIENKFIGYTTLEPENENVCEYSIFILDKNYWGKGVGEEVTKMILDYAFNKLKFEKIILFTSEYHKKAIELYERMGFTKTKLIPNGREIFLDGKWLLSGTVEMEKINN